MTGSNERNTFTNNLWDHVDDEFIDLAAVEKGSERFGPAHQPYVLAFLSTQAFGELCDGLVDQNHLRNCGRRQGTRKNVVLFAGIGIGHPLTNGKVVGLPSNNGDVNRAIEVAHAVVTLGPWTIEPVDR